MHFDYADPGNYLIRWGDSLIRHCSCAQAQLTISIGQDGSVWHENTQEEHTRNSLPTNEIVDKEYCPCISRKCENGEDKKLDCLFFHSFNIIGYQVE